MVALPSFDAVTKQLTPRRLPLQNKENYHNVITPSLKKKQCVYFYKTAFLYLSFIYMPPPGKNAASKLGNLIDEEQ